MPQLKRSAENALERPMKHRTKSHPLNYLIKTGNLDEQLMEHLAKSFSLNHPIKTENLDEHPIYRPNNITQDFTRSWPRPSDNTAILRRSNRRVSDEFGQFPVTSLVEDHQDDHSRAAPPSPVIYAPVNSPVDRPRADLPDNRAQNGISPQPRSEDSDEDVFKDLYPEPCNSEETRRVFSGRLGPVSSRPGPSSGRLIPQPRFGDSLEVTRRDLLRELLLAPRLNRQPPTNPTTIHYEPVDFSRAEGVAARLAADLPPVAHYAGERAFRCTECRMAFPDSAGRRQHLFSIHGRWCCVCCEATFSAPTGSYNHMKEQHAAEHGLGSRV